MNEAQDTEIAAPDWSLEPAAKRCKKSSKSEAIVKMLTRGRGATLTEVTVATGWQPHSARAFLSGLRKRGLLLVREERKNGDQAYHIAKLGSDS